MTHRCAFCDEQLAPDGGRPGRPRLYCDQSCRRDAFERRRLDALYPEKWQQKALSAGWRPPRA